MYFVFSHKKKYPKPLYKPLIYQNKTVFSFMFLQCMQINLFAYLDML